nr:MFS transporter [Amycolatopsis rubida]
MVGSLVAYVDRVNIGYAQLGMGAELGITAASYGLAAAIFFVAYFIFEVPSNILLARFGSRRWFARIMVSWGIVTVLTGFVHSTEWLYVARFALGLAEAGFFPGAVLYITKWYRAQDRARPLSYLVIAQPAAYLIGGATAGTILDHVHWLGQSPWRWIFFLSGIPAVAVGLVILKFLPERPADATWLDDTSRAWLVDAVGGEGVSEARRHGVRAQLAAFRNRRTFVLCAIEFVFSVGFYGFTLFVPLIIKQINPTYSATHIGFEAAIPYLCGMIGLMTLPRLGSTPGRLRYLGTGLSLFGTIGILGVILLREQPTPALISLSLAALVSFPFISVLWAIITHSLPKKHATVAFAAINSVGALAGFVGPYLVGQGSSGSTVTSGLLTPAIAMLLCTIFTAAFRIKNPEALAESTSQPSRTVST